MLNVLRGWRSSERSKVRRSASVRRDPPRVGRQFDEPLLWVLAMLMLGGLVMVYSASIALGDGGRYDHATSTYYLIRHLAGMAVAVSAGIAAFYVNVATWEKWAPRFFLLGIILLVLVLIPGVGKSVLGAQRWIPLGLINLQPSELMKFFVVLYVADYTVRKREYLQHFRKGILPMGAVVFVVALLLNLEPDLGAAIVVCAIATGMLYLGGINVRLFWGLVATAVAAAALVIQTSEFRRERILAYLAPFDPDHVTGRGYQLSRSLIAFGRGELTGAGLGASVEKHLFLPEPHTDFLLAIIGEELGLVGVLVVIVGFYWVTRRLFDIGRRSIALNQVYAGLVVYGVAIWLLVQSFINMGVNLGVLPTKGLTLPLMSYGGSALLANCISLGVVLRIDCENRRLTGGVR